MSFAIMTNLGRNAEAEALATGEALEITHIAWGDGDRIPAGGETALLNELGRKAVQGTGLVPEALNTAFFEILLDANEGPFVIREAGLIAADGTLVAIARFEPAVNKPLASVTALIRINVVFSDLENMILRVQSTDAYVPVERRIIAQNGVKVVGTTGGLDHDVTIEGDFATAAEVEAGVSAVKVLSPARLKAGLAALIDGTFMAALAAACGFSISLTANGYICLPSWLGGLILQWGGGVISNGGPTTGALPMAFPTAVFAMVASDVYDGVQTVSITSTKTSWTAWARMPTGSMPTTTSIKYLAVGY